MSEKEEDVRQVLLVGDTTLDPLGRLLERGENVPSLRTSSAPYGQVFQILLDGTHPLWASKPDILVVWTAPNLTLPSVARLLRFEFESAGAEHEAALREVAQFADAVDQGVQAGRSGARANMDFADTREMDSNADMAPWSGAIESRGTRQPAACREICARTEYRVTRCELLAGQLIQVGLRSAHVCGCQDSLFAGVV